MSIRWILDIFLFKREFFFGRRDTLVLLLLLQGDLKIKILKKLNKTSFFFILTFLACSAISRVMSTMTLDLAAGSSSNRPYSRMLSHNFLPTIRKSLMLKCRPFLFGKKKLEFIIILMFNFYFVQLFTYLSSNNWQSM